jgi:hypothetical protein
VWKISSASREPIEISPALGPEWPNFFRPHLKKREIHPAMQSKHADTIVIENRRLRSFEVANFSVQVGD